MGDNVVFLPASTEAMTSANVSVVNFMVLDMVCCVYNHEIETR